MKNVRMILQKLETQEHFNQFISNYTIVTSVLLTFDFITSGHVFWKLKDLGHILRILPFLRQSQLHTTINIFD